MRRRKVVETTLGDLIVSVTDEVRRFVRDPAHVYPLVSCIVADLLMRRRVPVRGRAAAGNGAEEPADDALQIEA